MESYCQEAVRLASRRTGRLIVPALTAAIFFSLLGDVAQSRLAGSALTAAPDDLEAEIDLRHDLTVPPEALIEPTPASVAPEPPAVARTIEVARGDTLMQLLVEAGVSRGEAHQAITAMADVFSPRRLMPGQNIELSLLPSSQGQRLLGLAFQPNADQDVRVTRAAGNVFEAGAFARELSRATVVRNGVIESNLFSAARAAAVPMPVLVEMIRAFSYDVDFQREIQPGDGFEVLFESFTDETGAFAKTGHLLYGALVLSGRRYELYRFEHDGVAADYFEPSGQSVRKALMRTPIDGARLSSGFGMRRHPILGYSKMHKGTDFAAPSGTPIYAAGNGVIEAIGRNGGYGNYIRVRHNSTFKTAYAHMQRFAKGLRRGSRVKQGDVIGYVGTTGRSTGPHLHYEVLRDNRQVNPLKVRLPSGQRLAGAALEAFERHRDRIDAERRERRERLQLVTSGCGKSDGETLPAAATTC